MKEITSSNLEKMLRDRESLTIVFVHTPLCGTCKMARGMVELVGRSFHSLPLYSLNINHASSFAQKWKVKSVPCLLLFQKGLGVERIYAFRSVSYIHEVLKPYAAAWSLQKGDR